MFELKILTVTIAVGVMPVAPYNPRNTNDPEDIEYRAKTGSRNTKKTFS